MLIISRHLQYLLAVLFALVVFATIGLLLLRAAWPGVRAEKRHQMLLAPGIGMATVTLATTMVSRYEIGISARLTWSVIAGITFVAGAVAWRRRDRSVLSVAAPVDSGTWWRSVWWLPMGSLVGLVPYAQLFLKDLIPAGYLTSATWTNNDLGAYLLTSTNVQYAGIGNAGLVAGIDVGKWARFDHPAAHVLFSTISGIFGTEPHKVGIVYMAIAIAVLWCASIVVVENLSYRRLSASRALLLAVAVINVGIVSTVANFFVSQVVTIAYLIVIFGVTCIAMKGSMGTGFPIVLAPIALASFLTSPEVTVPLAPLLVIVCVLHTKAWRDPRQLAVTSAVFVACIALVAAVRWEMISSQFEVVARNAGFAEAGWKSNFFSFAMLGGFVPTQFGGPFAKSVHVLDVLILAVLIGWLIRRVIAGTSGAGIPFGVSALAAMLVVGAARWGTDAYRTWKMVVTCSPFFVLLLLALAWKSGTGASRADSVSVAVCLIVIGASFAWTGEIWKSAGPSSYVNSDLASLATTPEARRQTELNIYVAPYFETMAAASVAGDRTLMASPSYFLPFGQPLRPGCTLTTKQNLANLKDVGPVIARRGNYLLVGTPRCK